MTEQVSECGRGVILDGVGGDGCLVVVIDMVDIIMCMFFFFFFKQKTAYEILTCDWSSDVCSSDLVPMVNYLEMGGSNVFLLRNLRFRWFPI